MKLEIILKNTTPYHSTQAGEARWDMKRGQVTYGKQGFPLTRTRSMPVISGQPGGEELPKARHVPIMPASSLRHALREQMLEEIFARILARKETLSKGAYAAAVSGNATGAPDGEAATFQEMREISAHPFLGIFGGGPRMMPGKLCCDMALPITDQTTSLVPAGHEERLVGGQILTVQQLRRVDPLLAPAPEAEGLITNSARELTEYHIEQTAAKGTTDDEDSRVRGLNALNFHEVVVPGVQWYWRLALARPTPAQIGMLLAGIAKLHGSHQGGMSRLGYGEIRIESVVLDGEEVWGGDEFLDVEATMAPAIALAESMDALDAAGFEHFAASVKKEKPAKQKKAPKKASVEA
jgi:CRISPR type IV-associated protein Csf2